MFATPHIRTETQAISFLVIRIGGDKPGAKTLHSERRKENPIDPISLWNCQKLMLRRGTFSEPMSLAWRLYSFPGENLEDYNVVGKVKVTRVPGS